MPSGRVGPCSLLVIGTVLLAWQAAAAGAAPRTAVELKGTYVLSGAVSRRGSFADDELVRSSCAQIASEGTGAGFVGGPNEFDVPGPPPTTGAAANVSFIASVTYKAPGTFSKEDILKSGGTSIIVGTDSYNAVATTAHASMTVRANASGSFTFSGAPPVKKGPSLSGKVTWSCVG